MINAEELNFKSSRLKSYKVSTRMPSVYRRTFNVNYELKEYKEKMIHRARIVIRENRENPQVCFKDCLINIRHLEREYQNQKAEQRQKGLDIQTYRDKIRQRDWRNKQYQWLKHGLANIQIHHEWIPETDKYTFSALVDTTEHQHGIIKPIIILEDNRIELLQ